MDVVYAWLVHHTRDCRVTLSTLLCNNGYLCTWYIQSLRIVYQESLSQSSREFDLM